jgi:hypothetical protein
VSAVTVDRLAVVMMMVVVVVVVMSRCHCIRSLSHTEHGANDSSDSKNEIAFHVIISRK